MLTDRIEEQLREQVGESRRERKGGNTKSDPVIIVIIIYDVESKDDKVLTFNIHL